MSVQTAVVPVTIRILDKEYQIACSEEERHSLLDSARYLNERMKEIRNSGKVIGSERIAVMAALNITHDLLQSRLQAASNVAVDGSRLKNLQEKVETALTRCKQLEL
ncbi:MAG: cell division protein ZapA [Gammaproteobacteria bacterium]|nr:cell division protein ZapA [Gammaproteobacteria bacterium]